MRLGISQVRGAFRPTLQLIGLWCSLVVIGCGAEQTSKPAQTQTEASPLVGRWKIVSATINGEEFDARGEPNIHVGGAYVFAEDTLTKYPSPDFAGADAEGMKYTYTADPSATPMQIVAKPTRKSSRGFDWPSEIVIYELAGDTLKLSWSLDPEMPVPTEFAAGEGSNHGLYVLERQ